MSSKSYVVYKIMNTITGDYYIGCTSDLHKRRIKHLSRFKRRSHSDFPLYRDMEKYGVEAYQWIELEHYSQKSKAFDRELQLIQLERPRLNSAKPGSATGRKISEQGKLNIKRYHPRKIPIRCKENGEEYESISEAARQLGCHSANINKVLKGSITQTGGYTFEKLEDQG